MPRLDFRHQIVQTRCARDKLAYLLSRAESWAAQSVDQIGD